MNTEFENTNLPEPPAPIGVETIPAPEKPSETVGFWTFLGLMVLFAIPVVGLISCIVFLFAPKKKTLKNYAGAVLTWTILRLIAVAVAVTILFTLVGGMILPALNEQFGTDLGNIFEVVGLVSDLEKGNYSKIIAQFRGPLLEMMGEEYAPLLDELSSGKYDEILDQVKNGEYSQILADLETEKYDELVHKLDPEDYRELKEELQKAANGQPSEVFDGFKTFLNESPTNVLDLLQ